MSKTFVRVWAGRKHFKSSIEAECPVDLRCEKTLDIRIFTLFSSQRSDAQVFSRCFVVYSFTCQPCSTSYGSQTTDHLHTRVSKNLGITPLTVKILKCPKFFLTLNLLDILLLLTILKYFLPAQTRTNSLFTTYVSCNCIYPFQFNIICNLHSL